MRYASVCSGIEAPSVAWHPLGWKPVFFSEIEKFTSRVLDHHYPDVPNLGDMTAIEGAAWRGKVDVLIGGTPCQAFSAAGKRESLADDRGNLSLTFCELVHAIDPICVVWENVPGVLSVKDNAFGCFLAGLVGERSGPLIPRGGTWSNAGMVVGPERSACWRILDAQYQRLAQRRRRVFVVSFRTRDRINPAAVLLEPESLPRNHPPRREAGAGVAGAVTNRIDRGGVNSEGHDGHLIPAPHADISPSLKARDGKGPSSDGDGDGAILVPMVTHSLRADGFDASEDGTGRGTPLVPAFAFNHQSGGDMRGIDLRETAQLQRCQMTAVAYSVDTYNQSLHQSLHQTLQRGTGCDQIGGVMTQGYGVRRLMPIECERLQGFPDGYTDIPGAKDGPRYKALGNSMAVPVIRWIGERIELVLKARGWNQEGHFLALANYTTARIEAGKVITSVGTHVYPVNAATAAKQFIDGLPVAMVETQEDVEVVRHHAGAECARNLADHLAAIGERSEVRHL